MPPRRPCPEGDGYKYCPDCGHCKPLSEFSRSASYCKAHQSARVTAAKAREAQRHPDRVRERKRAADRRYRETHKDQRTAYMREWKRRNPLKHATWNARWEKRNPEKRRAIVERYRARRGLRPAPPAPPALPAEILRELAQQERETRRDD